MQTFTITSINPTTSTLAAAMKRKRHLSNYEKNEYKHEQKVKTSHTNE